MALAPKGIAVKTCNGSERNFTKLYSAHVSQIYAFKNMNNISQETWFFIGHNRDSDFAYW
jgi:hypothetical protein